MEKFNSIVSVLKSFFWVKKVPSKHIPWSILHKVVQLYIDRFTVIDKQTLAYIYTHYNKSIYIILEGNVLAGFAIYTAKSNIEIHLKNIAISNIYEGKGYANILLEQSISELEKHYKKISLTVANNNIKAIHIYKKFGFEVVGCNDEGLVMYKYSTTK